MISLHIRHAAQTVLPYRNTPDALRVLTLLARDSPEENSSVFRQATFKRLYKVNYVCVDQHIKETFCFDENGKPNDGLRSLVMFSREQVGFGHKVRHE